MNDETHKVRDFTIAVALSALLIVGFVKFYIWLAADEYEEGNFVAPLAAAPDPAMPTPSSWPGVSYLEVRAYYSSSPFFYSFKRGIPDQVADKEGVLLYADQERQLISAVTTRVEPYGTADCWAPRHAFVFWDPFGKPVAEVDICFECLQVKGGPSDIPNISALADLASDLGLPLGEEDIEAFRRRFKRMQEESKERNNLPLEPVGEKQGPANPAPTADV